MNKILNRYSEKIKMMFFSCRNVFDFYFILYFRLLSSRATENSPENRETMNSQLEAQTTYQQYTHLYQIAAQMNELAKTDPSKTQEAQVASQQVSQV